MNPFIIVMLPVLSLDHHQLAAISITGSSLDVFGSLYLAYDLLGGKSGPLRTLTRMVTFGVLFGVGFGLIFGLAFGIAIGITHGVTLGIEFSRASTGKGRFPFRTEILFCVTRGVGFGLGTAALYGPEFGALFGVLGAAGQVAGYRMGLFPGMNYVASKTPRITRSELWAAVRRSIGYAVAGYVSAAVAGHRMHARMFGENVGIAIGVITGIANFIAPWVEWVSENMPDRRFGVLGIAMILCGFSLQSVQYWVVLLDITVR